MVSRTLASRVLPRACMVGALAVLLAGCGSLGKVAPAPQILDIGITEPAPQPLPPRAPLVLAPVEAAPLLQGVGVVWRQQGSQEPHSYASFQWASQPAELLAQRLRERLSQEGPVLSQRSGLQAPELRVNLERFEQVFDPAASQNGAASIGLIGVRAVLMDHGRVVDQLQLSFQVPAATADASGGARALRQGTDAVAEAVASWLSQQAVLQVAPRR